MTLSAELRSNMKGPRIPFKFTVEFPAFLTTASIALTDVTINNILLYRTCIHHCNYTKDECSGFLLPDKTNETHKLEENVQKNATLILTAMAIIVTIVPVVLSLFVGDWSDVHGRKPLIMWPLIGRTIASLLTAVYSMFDGIGPWWYLVASLPNTLFGGTTVLCIGVYCYISDVIIPEKRSLRMTLLDAILTGGFIVGSMASSPLTKTIGYVCLLYIVTLLNAVAVVFTVVCVKESLPGATKGGLKSLFVVRHVKNMVIDMFKRRPNNIRGQVLTLTLVNTLMECNDAGLSNLQYLYTRKKLKWAMADYTLYSSIDTMIALFVSIAGVVGLQMYLHVSDGVLIVVAVASATVSYLTTALAVRTWHMYLGAAITLLKGLLLPLVRSFLSKIVPIEDTAKIFGAMGVLSAFSPLIAPPLFAWLYNATLETYSGAVYMLSACITGACVVVIWIALYLHSVEPTSTSHQLYIRRNSLDT